MDFAALISDLKGKLAAANRRLSKLTEQRRPFALDAVTGDAKAKRAIEKIDAEAASLRSEADTLAIAIEEAEKRKTEYDARLVADDRRRRETEAREICKLILAKDREFDRTVALLHRTLTEREQLIGKLAGLNVTYRGVINAMRRKRNINGAMVHAGLDQFADLERHNPDARKSLVESDKSLSDPVMTGNNNSSVDEARQEGVAA